MAYFWQILTPNSPIRNHLYPSSNFCFLPIYCQGESRCFSLPCASGLKQGSRSEGGRTHRFDWAKWGRQRWIKSIGLNRLVVSRGAQWKIAPISSGKRRGKRRRLSRFQQKGVRRSAVVENLGSIFLFGTLNIYMFVLLVNWQLSNFRTSQCDNFFNQHFGRVHKNPKWKTLGKRKVMERKVYPSPPHSNHHLSVAGSSASSWCIDSHQHRRVQRKKTRKQCRDWSCWCKPNHLQQNIFNAYNA